MLSSICTNSLNNRHTLQWEAILPLFTLASPADPQFFCENSNTIRIHKGEAHNWPHNNSYLMLYITMFLATAVKKFPSNKGASRRRAPPPPLIYEPIVYGTTMHCSVWRRCIACEESRALATYDLSQELHWPRVQRCNVQFFDKTIASLVVLRVNHSRIY